MKKYRKVTMSYVTDHIGSFENWKKFFEMQAQYDFGGNFEVDGEEQYFAMATDTNQRFVRAYRLEEDEDMVDGRIIDADSMWCAEPSERVVYLEKI